MRMKATGLSTITRSRWTGRKTPGLSGTARAQCDEVDRARHPLRRSATPLLAEHPLLVRVERLQHPVEAEATGRAGIRHRLEGGRRDERLPAAHDALVGSQALGESALGEPGPPSRLPDDNPSVH